jgi:multiple sugar transport system substrate-binding protein
MKKLLSILIAVALIVSVASVALAEKTVVNVWRHSGKPAEQTNIVEQIDAFNAESDTIEIVYEVIPEGEYNTQIGAAALSGGLPDVFMLDGPNMSNYAWSGFLLPLDKYIPDEMMEDLLPSIIAQGTYDGQIYCIGSFDSGLAIWGNVELLESIGARIPTSAEDAWTLEEFNQILADLKAAGVEYPIDLKMNYGQGEWYTYGFSPIVESFGGDLIDRETLVAEGTYNGEANVAAMQWFQDIANQGYFDVAQVSDTYMEDGVSALALVGHWMANTYKDAMGDNVVLIPMVNFGNGVVTGMGSWAWGISSATEHPDEAWEVLSYFLSPENVAKTGVAVGAVPARKSVLATFEDYQPGGFLYIFRDQLEGGYAMERPTTAAYPVITTVFAEAFQNVVMGADVQEQLDEGAAVIDEDIADNDGYQ